jgi:hypothetical protein
MIESAVLVHAPYNIEVCFCFVSQVEPSFTKQRDVSLSLFWHVTEERGHRLSIFGTWQYAISPFKKGDVNGSLFTAYNDRKENTFSIKVMLTKNITRI